MATRVNSELESNKEETVEKKTLIDKAAEVANNAKRIQDTLKGAKRIWKGFSSTSRKAIVGIAATAIVAGAVIQLYSKSKKKR